VRGGWSADRTKHPRLLTLTKPMRIHARHRATRSAPSSPPLGVALVVLIGLHVFAGWRLAEQLAVNRWGVPVPATVSTAAAMPIGGRAGFGRWTIHVAYTYERNGSWTSSFYKRTRLAEGRQHVERVRDRLLASPSTTAWVVPQFPTLVALNRSVDARDYKNLVTVLLFLDLPLTAVLLVRAALRMCRPRQQRKRTRR
jgi:hypothetical protein